MPTRRLIISPTCMAERRQPSHHEERKAAMEVETEELRCEYSIEVPDDRERPSPWRCDRTDTQAFEMHDGGSVRLCPRHRSVLPGLGVSK